MKSPKKSQKKQEELLRAFDKEAEESGRGISGRLAQAAGSAFETFFGSSEKKEDKDSNSKEKEVNDDEEDEKKEQAQ